jgi:hypothetical protein
MRCLLRVQCVNEFCYKDKDAEQQGPRSDIQKGKECRVSYEKHEMSPSLCSQKRVAVFLACLARMSWLTWGNWSCSGNGDGSPALRLRMQGWPKPVLVLVLAAKILVASVSKEDKISLTSTGFQQVLSISFDHGRLVEDTVCRLLSYLRVP